MDTTWLMFKLVLWAVAQLLVWGVYWQGCMISHESTSVRTIRDTTGRVVYYEETCTSKPPNFRVFVVVDLVLLFIALFIA